MRKKASVISTGYKPVPPGIWTNTMMMHRPMPICWNDDDSVYVMHR